MSEATSSRKIAPTAILALIGQGLGYLVFMSGMWIGMSIDPLADMRGRLVAYTAALFGLTTAFACRWAEAERGIARTFYMTLTLVSLAFCVVYGLVNLL